MYGASTHDIEIPEQKQYAHNEAPYSPIEHKLVRLFSKHPAQQNWCFDYENSNKLQRMTTQNVRKKIVHVLHFKCIILIKYFSSYNVYQKVLDRNLLFWLSVF